MPYIIRDANGKIKTLFRDQPPVAHEFIQNDNPELLAFLAGDDNMLSLDLGFIRVIEDVIDVLVQKSIIMYTDLPGPVQSKLNKRRSARASNEPSMFDEKNVIRF